MPGHKFYNSREWRQLRGSFLKANPICYVPGCGQPATRVDHIISRRLNEALQLEWSNLRQGCVSHDSAKTNAVDGGFGRKPVTDYQPVVKGCDASGSPRDLAHPWNRS